MEKCGEYSLQENSVRYPDSTAISLKNIKNAVLRNTEKYEETCSDVWITDVRQNHVRNSKLLDLPFTRAKCCSDIYNVMVDRQKLKKLKRYHLTRPVRTITTDLTAEVLKRCSSGESSDQEHPIHKFQEYYRLSESESEDEEPDILLKACSSGSLTQCSGCSTIGPVKKQKIHQVPKLHWQDLLHGSQVEYCKKVVTKLLTKYKGDPNAALRLKKYYLK